jgi:hypothetical protein
LLRWFAWRALFSARYLIRCSLINNAVHT